MSEMRVNTSDRVQFVDITSEIRKLVNESKVKEGICTVFVPHTTAAVTINENADPDVTTDMKKELNKVIPFNDNYKHLEGNSAAHIKSTLVGASESIIIENGNLALGSWQGIFFCEFDGPRSRKVWVKILAFK